MPRDARDDGNVRTRLRAVAKEVSSQDQEVQVDALKALDDVVFQAGWRRHDRLRMPAGP